MITVDRNDVLIYDIECWSNYDIQQEFDMYTTDAKAKWVGFYSYKTDRYYEIPVLGNEDLIRSFMMEHRVIVGFNSEEFDDVIMKNTRNNLWPERYKISIDVRKVLAENRGYLMGYKFKKNSLKEMAITMGLETSKGDIDYTIFQKDIWTDDEKNKIKEYLRADVKITKEMFDKLWDFWMPFTNFISDKNIKNLSWITASEGSLAYKWFCFVMGIDEEFGEKGEKTDGGGRVIEPRVDEEWDVWYCDVASLYPHMYVMFNLFAEVSANTAGAWHGNDMFKVNGYYDISSRHPFCVDLGNKLSERFRLKDIDPKNPLVYTYKILANSSYGANRSTVFKRMYTPNSGADCCYLGRQVNMFMEKKMGELGYDTISGDTDSVFLKYQNGKRTYAEVQADLQQVVNEILKNVPFPMPTFKIAIEAQIDYIMFVSDEEKTLKKNYCYIKTLKDGSKKITIMGLPIKKANSTKLGPYIFETFIKPRMIAENKGKFEKKWLVEIVESELKKDYATMAQEYRPSKFESYSPKGRSSLSAQISKTYLAGLDGRISLIKNKRIGKVGGSWKYCTLEEAKQGKLLPSEVSLEKVYNELQPFCKEDLSEDNKSSKRPSQENGFFSSPNASTQTTESYTPNLQPELTVKRGFF